MPFVPEPDPPPLVPEVPDVPFVPEPDPPPLPEPSINFIEEVFNEKCDELLADQVLLESPLP